MEATATSSSVVAAAPTLTRIPCPVTILATSACDARQELSSFILPGQAVASTRSRQTDIRGVRLAVLTTYVLSTCSAIEDLLMLAVPRVITSTAFWS